MNAIGTAGDFYHKQDLQNIIDNGTWDKYDLIDHNVIGDIRTSHYSDGTTARVKSVFGVMHKFDLSNGEFPIITLRPIATKKAIGEILWIYQDQSNDLNLLNDKYGVSWWDNWDIGDRTIGSVYGATVKKYDLMNTLLKTLKDDPDNRRHIMSLWQYEDFKTPHGLKPCAFQTIWNVRHVPGVDYLDMMIIIRSQDTPTAQVINQVQYCVLLCMVAQSLGYTPGVFTYVCHNMHIYDRHIEACKELIKRTPIKCNPYVRLNPDIHNFYDFTPDDIKIEDYPIQYIKLKNPQITVFRDEIGI